MDIPHWLTRLPFTTVDELLVIRSTNVTKHVGRPVKMRITRLGDQISLVFGSTGCVLLVCALPSERSRGVCV